MRRLIEIVLPIVFVSLLNVPGCNRQPQKAPVEATEEEEAATLAPMVHVADPHASAQLLRGFYDIEQNSWRWTMKNFSVTLRPPVGAAQNGATLQLRFSVPDPVINRLKSITLSAKVNDVTLPGETYAKPGGYVYSRDVPAETLRTPAVTVDFTLDKVLPAGDVDQRELGLVVSTIGLEVK